MSDTATIARPAVEAIAPEGLGASVEALPLRGMVTLRGDLADAGFADALKAATGCAMPDTRASVEAGDNRVLWMSPDELMVFCPAGQAASIVDAFMEKTGDAHALALDVSDARGVFRVSGEKAAIVLNKGVPVDLRDGAFPVGSVRRTRLATVAVGLVRVADDAFEVFVFRSYADYLWNWLIVAARQDGLSDL